ncbi:P-loop NTPase fold protein [Kaistia geumhonensis]|uniref:KAP-like P-loop ATPase n=1 Tax=Kaistia geumhonensis TaxID=410839 RepID=A0ABU0M9P2_9HYPH|nr:P-loop NTPase fold protein [Kaistia geumhonensis]MCX5480613.1 P-loop NTPase fold protein [Kaistia geumhonensis]MDQ0517685.1 putative KAP-like P-loop ATPase [Kaistia geumhonensis]
MFDQLSGDKPLNGPDSDRLGFRAGADALARSLLNQRAVDGLVVGVEGPWGSGKSSFLNMVVAILRSDINSFTYAIEYRPWLIGDSKDMLLSLFADLAIAVDAIEAIDGDPSSQNRRQVGDTATQITRFARRLGGVGMLARAAGVLVPGAAIAGDILQALAATSNDWLSDRSLLGEKNDIRKRLSKLKKRIVVVIDDVDRLEPIEILEVFRLIRSVADFPNVIYILGYDADIVKKSIGSVIQLDSGQQYLEKIVQVSINVPKPEPLDLRFWFRSEIEALLPAPIDDLTQISNFDSIIDFEVGRYLKTPRQVVRCLDSIRIFWDLLIYKVDIVDLVWINVIKAGNIDLYNWIERYISIVSVYATGQYLVDEGDKAELINRLQLALSVEGGQADAVADRLVEFLLGIEDNIIGGTTKLDIFADFSRETLYNFIRAKRLSSPDHYRLYFALDQPKNSPTNDDYAALIEAAADSSERVESILIEWLQIRLSTGISKAEIIIARLSDSYTNSSFHISESILFAMSNNLDLTSNMNMDEPNIWSEGRRLTKRIIGGLGHEREETLKRLFQGRAIEWLTTILRSDLFAHGRVDQRPRSSETLLEPHELDMVSRLMIDRYRRMDLASWRNLKRPLNGLFAWLQAGDPDEPKAFLKTASRTDDGFVAVLELLSSRVFTAKGSRPTLQRTTLSHLLDYDLCRDRIQALAMSSTSPELQTKAGELLEMFERGERS